jgi:cell wall assembly regulator SMI1
MGRKSKIEAHPQSEEIIRRLASKEDYSKIVEDFPDIRYQDLDYYAENKLPEILSNSKDLKTLADEIESADIHKGDTYLQLVIGLQKKALDALELQDATKDPKSWAMISREARGYVELLGKALDRIRDAPQIQVNLLVNPQWIELRASIIQALEPYPLAKEAVLRAIE